MTQVSARLPDDLVRSIDETARRLNRSRAEVIRQATENELVVRTGHRKNAYR